MNHIEILLLAIILDAIFGEPDWLWGRVSHPVQILGNSISWLEKKLNVGANRKIKGFIAIGALSLAGGFFAWLIAKLPDYGLLEVLVVAVLLAHKSLVQHVMNVAKGLAIGIEEGRLEVAKIVGRSTTHMQPSDVSRAAVESAAENFSDGVIAPAFWFLFFGLPGLVIYKIVNTADSMVGYKSEQFLDFGFASAKIDDLMNWIPARLTSLFICLTSNPKKHVDVVLDDAPLHRSPNAGWPEAAMAAVLDVALSGPRVYDGQLVEYPFVNADGRHQLSPEDIRKSVSTLNIVWAGIALVLFVIILIF